MVIAKQKNAQFLAARHLCGVFFQSNGDLNDLEDRMIEVLFCYRGILRKWYWPEVAHLWQYFCQQDTSVVRSYAGEMAT